MSGHSGGGCSPETRSLGAPHGARSHTQDRGASGGDGKGSWATGLGEERFQKGKSMEVLLLSPGAIELFLIKIVSWNDFFLSHSRWAKTLSINQCYPSLHTCTQITQVVGCLITNTRLCDFFIGIFREKRRGELTNQQEIMSTGAADLTLTQNCCIWARARRAKYSKPQVSIAFKSGLTTHVAVYATGEEAVCTSISTFYHLRVLVCFLKVCIYLGKVSFQNKIYGK